MSKSIAHWCNKPNQSDIESQHYKLVFKPKKVFQNTAKLSTQWLKEKKVNVLAWPDQSPDLNLTENPWNDLKTAVHEWSPSNLTELEQFCKEEWTNITKSRCAKSVERHPSRLKAVIKAKGGSTKYFFQLMILFFYFIFS